MVLEEIRSDIDEVNKEIVHAYEKRAKLVDQVAQYKLENDMEVLDSAREDIVIDQAKSYLDDKSLEGDIEKLFKSILKISRDSQNRWIQGH